MAHRYRESGVAGIELVAGLGAAVACGVLWAVVAYYLEREFVYAALGVGAAVGFAVAATVKQPNVGNGISAAGLSAIGLLLGKFLIIQWSISGTFVNELVNDPEGMTEAVFYKMATSENADPQVKAWYLDPDSTQEDADPVLSIRLAAGYAAAQQTANGLSVDEKIVLAEAYADYISESMTVMDKVKAGLSAWDVAFFGLAMFVAFQIGRGGVKTDEDGGDGGELTTLIASDVADAGSETNNPEAGGAGDVEAEGPPRSETV